MKSRAPYLRAAMRKPGGAIGGLILVFVLVVAFAGPLFAPYDPNAIVGPVGALPGAGHILGTDFLGRDVLSRILFGGPSVVLMGAVSTVLAYAVGVSIGIVAGSTGGWRDMSIMRGVDVLLAFPALMVLLLLVGGLGQHIWVLVLGVILVQVPGIARISRAAALGVSRSEFVEAARIRGDRSLTIWTRDVLANILPTVLADFGVRFGISIILIASMNYVGLGLNPPSADWGLAISENQNYLSLNPFAVLGPALMLAAITIGVNLVADGYIRAVHAGSADGPMQLAAREEASVAALSVLATKMPERASDG